MTPVEEFDCSGFWWFPRSGGDRLAGRLSFTRSDGLRLSLIGPANLSSPPSELRRLPLILGITDRNEEITLAQCTEVHRSTTTSGICTQEFIAEVGFIGAHFDSPEQLRFHTMAVEYSYLPDWVRSSGFEWSFGSPDIKMKFRPPEARRAKIPEGELIIGFGFETAGDWLTTLEIRSVC
ncbi:MAG: hypothetical protein ACREJA_05715 [Candidatus Methylomirabilales bacterium]